MQTLQLLAGNSETIPASTSWIIADLAEARGRQASYLQQSGSQRLRALREEALVESAEAACRMEGVNGNREEKQGYRKALDLIHKEGANLPVSVKTLRQLYLLACGKSGDAENPPSSYKLDELLTLWSRSLEKRWMHPLIILAMFNLDFLRIHSFREKNTSLSFLLLLLQGIHLGYDVGRYVSLELLIEQTQDQYRKVLAQSSQGWFSGQHKPWPYIDYLLSIFKTAYMEFESRLDVARSPRGSKTELIEEAVKSFPGEFTLTELEEACLTASHDMVRKVLRDLRDSGAVECLGRGPGARWRKKEHSFAEVP